MSDISNSLLLLFFFFPLIVMEILIEVFRVPESTGRLALRGFVLSLLFFLSFFLDLFVV